LYSPYYFPFKVLVKFSHYLRLKWIPYDSYPVSVTFPSISVAQTIKPWRATNKFQPHDGRGGCQLTLFFLHLEPSLNCHVAATTCCWSIRSPTRLDSGQMIMAMQQLQRRHGANCPCPSPRWSPSPRPSPSPKSKSKPKTRCRVPMINDNKFESLSRGGISPVLVDHQQHNGRLD